MSFKWIPWQKGKKTGFTTCALSWLLSLARFKWVENYPLFCTIWSSLNMDNQNVAFINVPQTAIIKEHVVQLVHDEKGLLNSYLSLLLWFILCSSKSNACDSPAQPPPSSLHSTVLADPAGWNSLLLFPQLTHPLRHSSGTTCSGKLSITRLCVLAHCKPQWRCVECLTLKKSVLSL